MNKENITTAAFSVWPAYDEELVNELLRKELENFDKKIVVLDDDPTGVQTVHDVFVYTDWSVETLCRGLYDENRIFFVLTNSRGLTEAETAAAHRAIAENLAAAAALTGIDYLLISRCDSTLRGHYPIETEILKDTLEELGKQKYDGEIIIPFFPEGGRYTIENIHYVADGDELRPVGSTEFARDKTFWYTNSDLTKWVEEKTKGRYPADQVRCISLDELRACDYSATYSKLDAISDFGKVIVNAIDYNDVKVFTTALLRCIKNGKNFMFRTAASFPKVVGGVGDRALLTRKELASPADGNGGVVIVGSHVNKTTRQLEALRKHKQVTFIEFNQHLVTDDVAFAAEIERVVMEANQCVARGKTVAVYTNRERFDLNNGNREDELRIAVKISNAVTGIIARLSVRPSFIVAKGGITSSDVGTKALRVKRALVLGQVLKGIPVWLTGDESLFPNMPYVIFPGNVGDYDALYNVVCVMQSERNIIDEA